jgi:hypothetical protein
LFSILIILFYLIITHFGGIYGNNRTVHGNEELGRELLSPKTFFYTVHSKDAYSILGPVETIISGLKLHILFFFISIYSIQNTNYIFLSK